LLDDPLLSRGKCQEFQDSAESVQEREKYAANAEEVLRLLSTSAGRRKHDGGADQRKKRDEPEVRKENSRGFIGRPRNWNAIERGLPFQEIHFVGEDGFAIAKEGQDDAEADDCFGGRVGKDEEGEDLSRNIAEVTRKSDQVDIDGVRISSMDMRTMMTFAARSDADAADQEERKAQE